MHEAVRQRASAQLALYARWRVGFGAPDRVLALAAVSWYRDGRLVHTWTVGLGIARTPDALGRTYVIARTTLPGRVYAGVDVLTLGAIPDDPSVVPVGLRGAYIGIHA